MKRVLYCKSTMDVGRRLLVVSSKAVVIVVVVIVVVVAGVGSFAEMLASTTIVPARRGRGRCCCCSCGCSGGVVVKVGVLGVGVGAATARRREHGVAARDHRVAVTVPHDPHVLRQTPAAPPQPLGRGKGRGRATTIGPRRRRQRVRGRALPVEHSLVWRRFEEVGVGRVAARVQQAKLARRVALLPVRGHGDVGRQSHLRVGWGVRRMERVRVGGRGVPGLVGAAVVAGQQGHGLLVAVLRGACAGGQTLQQSERWGSHPVTFTKMGVTSCNIHKDGDLCNIQKDGGGGGGVTPWIIRYGGHTL